MDQTTAGWISKRADQTMVVTRAESKRGVTQLAKRTRQLESPRRASIADGLRRTHVPVAHGRHVPGVASSRRLISTSSNPIGQESVLRRQGSEMVATPDDELTEQDILRRAASEQERADLLKRRGFIEAAILRGKEVTELIEIARVTNVSERIDRIRLIYRQRSRDKKRDPLFASSYAVKGWKAHRTTQESRLRRAKSTEEKIDAETQIRKYDLVIARAEGLLSFNPMRGDEHSLEAELLSQPIRAGIIYLAHCDNWGSYMKVGCTTDWFHRQSMLQTGVPENIRLWAFAKTPAATDLILYEYKFHLALGDARHPLGREFFKTDVSLFEAAAGKLKSPIVRSRQPGRTDFEKSDVSLIEELKDTDL
jgi:hypothetical protein